jgi:NADH-quinone oxidoreductase subunit J
MDSNLVQQVIWYFFAALTVLSAAAVVFSRSLIYSAFSLLFTFFGVAALYVFLGADFLAATQVVIYVGGILVLLLFGVMLTHKLYSLNLRTETFQFFPGLLMMAAVLLTLAGVITRTEWHKGPERPLAPTTAQIGELFMRDYVLPFEVASIFLLIALIGAAMIVRRRGMQ